MKKSWCLLAVAVALSLFASCSKPAAPTYVEELIKLPETKEELVQRASHIVSVEVKKTEIKSFFTSYTDDTKEDFYCIDAEVTAVLKGDLETGKKIAIIQQGDGTNRIFKSVEQSGGYLQDGSQWLLFLEEGSEIEKQQFYEKNQCEYPYMIWSIVGQFKINENQVILSITNEAKDLFGDVKTVADMQSIVDDIVQ